MLQRLFLTFILTTAIVRAERPGIVLITVDGLGWGDLSASGNAQVATPRMDKLLAESAVLKDFHVSPLDAPSRAALLTGLDPLRAGVWGCHSGRNRLKAGVLTLAGHLKAAGYTTGLFGTWALGDNHPSRPQDHGYDQILTHPGSTPGSVADFYSNDGTDDLWILNGEATPRTGANLDVSFGTAQGFIEKNAAQPFFCHIAPSLPAGMPESAIEPFQNRPEIPLPLRAAWISTLDTAVGNLLDDLDRLAIAKSTLVILTSTSGMHSAGREPDKQGFNAGRRGSRGSPYDGGHCVPFMVRWPDGGVTAGSLTAAAAHVDLLPTVAELTANPLPPDLKLDGQSLAAPLRDPKAAPGGERILVTCAQEVPVPLPWRQNCVMAGSWRLINGLELYDLRTDPGQRKNVAATNADTVQRLRAAGETWWKSVSESLPQPVRSTVGGPQDPVLLTPHDWQARGAQPITRDAVISGTPANGQLLLEVTKEGAYDILLRRWPLTVERPIADSFFQPEKARLRMGTVDETKPVPAGATGVNFRVTLKPGPLALQTWFTAGDKTCGAYFVELRKAVEVRSAKPAPQPPPPRKP